MQSAIENEISREELIIKTGVPTWNTENPPKDGSPIVVVGRVICSDEFSTSVQPFAGAVKWLKTESNFEGWCWCFREYPMCVQQTLEDEVNIDFWMPFPS